MPPRYRQCAVCHDGNSLIFKSMKSKKVRRITPNDLKSVLGILANLVKLLYEIYKIVAHR